MERRIVITGIGAVSPAGLSAAALAEAVRSGRSAVGAVRRFDASGYPTRVAGEAAAFDAAEGIRKEQSRYVKKMAKVMAIDIQLALAATNLAVLDTGLPLGDPTSNEPVLPTIDHTRFGMVFGTSFIPTELEDLAIPVQASRPDGRFNMKAWGSQGIPKMFPLWLLKHLPNMHTCHAGILWDAQGVSNSLTTSDAGGLLALDEAMRILRRGAADLMLAGGAESRVNPLLFMRYCLLDRLTPSRADPATVCRPFDLGRTGQVAAEGATVLMLEDDEAARRRGAKIYGEVLGTGGSTMTAGINACDADGGGVMRAVRRAMEAAGLEPSDLGAVYAHGTALEAQDRGEAVGLAAALGKAATTVPVTATKGITGNMGAASGLADLAAAMFLAKDGQVPPIANCDRPDKESGLALVTGRPAAMKRDTILFTTNAIGGQTAAAVVRVER